MCGIRFLHGSSFGGAPIYHIHFLYRRQAGETSKTHGVMIAGTVLLCFHCNNRKRQGVELSNKLSVVRFAALANVKMYINGWWWLYMFKIVSKIF